MDFNGIDAHKISTTSIVPKTASDGRTIAALQLGLKQLFVRLLNFVRSKK